MGYGGMVQRCAWSNPVDACQVRRAVRRTPNVAALCNRSSMPADDDAPLADLLATRALLEREVDAQRRRERGHAASLTAAATLTARLTRLRRAARDRRRAAAAALLHVEHRVRDARRRLTRELTREALAAETRIPLAVLEAHVLPACDIDARLALGVPPRRWWTTPEERAAFEASPRCAAVARFTRLNAQRRVSPQELRLPIWYDDDDANHRRWPDDDEAARAFIYVYQGDSGDEKDGYLCSTCVETFPEPRYLHEQQLPIRCHRDQFRGMVDFIVP